MFGIKQPKKGLFGAASHPYGTPPIAPETSPQGQIPAAMGMQAMPQRSPGLGTRLFGQGWEDKAFALGGLMQGDPSGAYMMRRDAREQQQAAAAASADTLKRARDLADWQWKKEWERDNPAAVNNDTINDFNWYKGLSDADREIYHRMKPEYMTVDNGDGTKSIIPIGANGPVMGNQGGPTLPSFSEDDWNKAGGTGSNVGGGFR